MATLKGWRLAKGRQEVLKESYALVHALTCATCGLRVKALAALRIVGWTEREFYDRVFLTIRDHVDG